MKLSQMVDSPFKRVLIFGRAKSGKTKLAGALSKSFNINYIGGENGHVVFRQFPQEWQERINIINIPDTRSYPMFIETCLKLVRGEECKICVAHGKVSCALCQKDKLPEDTVALNKTGPDTINIFDSLTQLTNSAISNITKNKPDDYKLDWDDWGKLGVLMDKFLSHIQQAQYNVICISHETEAELESPAPEEKKPIILVPTAGTRNFSRNTAKYFDDVIYCEVKNKEHKFGSATNYAMGILTGSRSGVKLEDMKEASLESIFKKV